MAAVKGHPFGRLRAEQYPKSWERTPWWMFWRPSWRRRVAWWAYDRAPPRWEYTTKRTLAKNFLAEQFSPRDEVQSPPPRGGRVAKI